VFVVTEAVVGVVGEADVVVGEADGVVTAACVLVGVELELLLPPHPPMASVLTAIAAAASWLAFLGFIAYLRCGLPRASGARAIAH
jgi:hypothetical protein